MGVKPANSSGFRAAELTTYTATYTETHAATKRSRRTGRAARYGLRRRLIDRIAPRACFTRPAATSSSPLRLIDQQQVDAFTREPMVMIESFRVHQRDVRLTVLGDDLFGASFDLSNQYRESGANLREGIGVVLQDSHGRSRRNQVPKKPIVLICEKRMAALPQTTQD